MRRLLLYICIALNVLGATISLSACYDDKGNYDYIELDEVEIDTVGLGIQEEYVVSRYEQLTIEPKVLFNGVEANNDASVPLDYLWTMYTAHSGLGVTYAIDTLANTVKLDTEITSVAGNYVVQLTVTNRNTGVKNYFSVSCAVEGDMPTGGWLVLYETPEEEGYSDFGLIINPLTKRNVTSDTDKSYWDLYQSSNGTRLEGAPKRILRDVVALASGDDPIICHTGNNLIGVNNDTFEKILNWEDFFFEAPANRDVAFFGTGGVSMRNEKLINDNSVYTVSYNSTSRNNYFGTLKSGDYGELAPWGSDVHSTYYDAVVYDQTAGCFRCVNRSSVNITSFGAQDPNAAFDVNSVGMEFLMGDWGRNYMDLFLMKENSDYYLLIANFQLLYSATAIGQGKYNITQSPEIANATSMSAAYNGEYVLYGAGSNVYALHYNASTVADVAWTAPSANEEVTCVRLQKYYYRAFTLTGYLPNANTVVHIATWNESTQEGKVYEYTIDQASGEISGEPYIYTVPGKVKDMSWRYAMT